MIRLGQNQNLASPKTFDLLRQWWWWCQTPPEGWRHREILRRPNTNSRATPRSGLEIKIVEVVSTMVRRSSDAGQSRRRWVRPAVDDRRRCKKNSPSILSCLEKRTKEGCDRGSKVGTVHGGKGPAPLRKLKESSRRENCEKDFVSRQHRGYALSLQWQRIAVWVHQRRKALLWFWQASLPVHYRKVQNDQGPTGSLELHERKESRRVPKYPRRTLVGETRGVVKEGQGPIGSQSWKGPIENDMS